ncbi:hypothetical protein [Microbacterium maritypicum]|uniref:Uncharacterized protein n=1 Tax=Microbacterium maritypicum MF109 TaxID=1333857 RepID=T5KUH3_MICMQ|nr:hypothetical protein [Microbacterium liquefaciens]EQM83407.1 hypothetical protein L687_12370 [Microbacterium maritypicum MF109]
MATKYDVLRALVDLDRDKWGDQMGLHNVITNIIDAISETRGSEEELADGIYDIIAESFTPSRVEKDPAS